MFQSWRFAQRLRHLARAGGPGLRAATTVGAGSAAAVLSFAALRPAHQVWADTSGQPGESTNPQDELPVFSRAEVQKHRDPANGGIWVTVGEYVYDVTGFLEEHPGGADKLLLAAGGAVEPFWDLYTIHRQPASARLVAEYLERFRIGRLDPADHLREASEVRAGPYANEPDRLPVLKPLQKQPFNAEVPAEVINAQPLPLVQARLPSAGSLSEAEEALGHDLDALVDENDFLTPNALWFVRHHHPVPVVDPEEFRLRVCGAQLEDPQERPRHTRSGAALPRRTRDTGCIELALQEIKERFQKQEVIATIQCAGNRRLELEQVDRTQGLHWKAGAISTAKFGGVWLRDLMALVGVEPGTPLRHVHADGLDQPFAGSIPMEKALSDTGDVLVAYEMNGEEIPRDHGYPLRLVVPGAVGARQIKWLSTLRASDEESPSPWQRRFFYKGMSPSVRATEGLDPEVIPSVQELPVQSAFTNVKDGDVIELDSEDAEDTLRVAGWAWSGGGRGISRVEVTPDQGKSWFVAQLHQLPAQQWNRAYNRAWAWTLWEAELPVAQLRANVRPREGGQDDTGASGEQIVELAVRAVDVGNNVQPERAEHLWNLRGILNNSWHRVRLQAKLGDSEPGDSAL